MEQPTSKSASLGPLVSRRQALSAALVGFPSIAAAHSLPNLIAGVLGVDPGAIASVGLFALLDRPVVPASARFLLSTGYRTEGKGVALYAASAEREDLTQAGRSLIEAAIAKSPVKGAGALSSLTALERHWRVRAADGRWFSLVGSHESDMFGTIGDGAIHYDEAGTGRSSTQGTIVTAQCQTYLDYCTYFVQQPAHWSAGIHLIDDVLHAGYGDTFHQTVMTGAGSRFGAETNFTGTGFVSTKRDRPLFNFAGQRTAKLEDVYLGGHFAAHRRAAQLATADSWRGPTQASNFRHDVDPQAWVDRANPPSADSRYAPYAAITIDAYAGSRPDVPYPTPIYPDWLPSLKPWAGAALSSAVEFDRVGITGFVVGLMIGPSNSPAQGDFVQFHRGQITDCKWAISVGNHQSRNVAVRDTRIAACWTALANNFHGVQAGRFGGSIDNVSFGEVINIFDFNQYAGAMQFTACYGEAIWRLGWQTAGNGFATGATFSRCTWSFSDCNAWRGVAPSLLDDRFNPVNGGYGMVDFPGTVLVVQSVAVIRKAVGSGSVLVQPEQRVNGVPEPGSAWRRDAANALHGGLALAELDPRGRSINVDTLMLNLDTGAPSGIQHNGSPAPRSQGSSIYSERLGLTFGDTIPRPRGPYILSKSLIERGSVAFAGKEMSLSLTRDIDAYEDGTLRGIGPGGVWMDGDSGTILFCLSADYHARRLTFELQNNFRQEGGQQQLITPIAWYSGADFSIVHGRYYTPARPLVGDLTKGSLVITNVGPTDNASEMADREIALGDGLFLMGNGGLAHAGRIETIDRAANGLSRITLDRRAAVSVKGSRLALFVRRQPPNGRL